jgi:hypothetical protein
MGKDLITATLALTRGDPLGALRLVALRDDAPALALRGVAMAQLGELGRARELLQAAARAFGPHQGLARARCAVALAEVALAARDLGAPQRGLLPAVRTLLAHHDRANALHGQLLVVRRLVLLGRLVDAERALAPLDLRAAPEMQRAIAELLRAHIALRAVNTTRAREALKRARRAAERTGIVALIHEVEAAARELTSPAARWITGGHSRPVTLVQVESLLASDDLIVDACRRRIRGGTKQIDLQRRPVLLALARSLAESWPSAVTRERLIGDAFGLGRSTRGATGIQRAEDSHRARLRVEVGRLRKLLAGLAVIEADREGYVLVARDEARHVAVLAPPIDGEDAALAALLADGSAWSSSALASALGSSQRNVQRSLASLEAAGAIHAIGRARARRWLTSSTPDFVTTLLLPLADAGD